MTSSLRTQAITFKCNDVCRVIVQFCRHPVRLSWRNGSQIAAFRYLPTPEDTYVRTYVHTYIHTYIHACMHTYIHAYIHTYIHVSHIGLEPAIPVSKCPLNKWPVKRTPFYYLSKRLTWLTFSVIFSSSSKKITMFTELGMKVMPVENPQTGWWTDLKLRLDTFFP